MTTMMNHTDHTHNDTADAIRVCVQLQELSARLNGADPGALSVADAIVCVLGNPDAAVARGNADTEAWIMRSGSRRAQARVIARHTH